MAAVPFVPIFPLVLPALPAAKAEVGATASPAAPTSTIATVVLVIAFRARVQKPARPGIRDTLSYRPKAEWGSNSGRAESRLLNLLGFTKFRNLENTATNHDFLNKAFKNCQNFQNCLNTNYQYLKNQPNERNLRRI